MLLINITQKYALENFISRLNTKIIIDGSKRINNNLTTHQ